MVGGSRLVIFYLKSSVFRARVGKSLARCLHVFSVQKILLQKLYLRFCLAQIVHSKNGKILLPWQKTCLSKFLQCTAHILLFLSFSKESCVFDMRFQVACLELVSSHQKMLSFSCVCSMKMGLLKGVFPVLFDKKTVNFDLTVR